MKIFIFSQSLPLSPFPYFSLFSSCSPFILLGLLPYSGVHLKFLQVSFCSIILVAFLSVATCTSFFRFVYISLPVFRLLLICILVASSFAPIFPSIAVSILVFALVVFLTAVSHFSPCIFLKFHHSLSSVSFPSFFHYYLSLAHPSKIVRIFTSFVISM